MITPFGIFLILKKNVCLLTWNLWEESGVWWMFGVCNLRCLPLNFRKDELKGIYKDRMKIGASLADVDPMQLDSSVSTVWDVLF